MDPNELNALGNDLKDAGRYDEAEDAYRRSAEAAQFNERALTCEPAGEEAYWNLGIAATALGMGLGLVPIRLDPDGNGEVVWCDRLDPARALIRNVPTLESGFREGDIVLHDGEPKGKRELNGKFVSVFNALERIAEESGVVIEDW